MTYQEMINILKKKIFTKFTDTYLFSGTNDPNLDYLKIRNFLLKLLDINTYEYSTKSYVYNYDLNSPVILNDGTDSKEVVNQDLLAASAILIQNIITDLMFHTTYYPIDIKEKYINFLNAKEEEMLNKIQELQNSKHQILAKVI